MLGVKHWTPACQISTNWLLHEVLGRIAKPDPDWLRPRALVRTNPTGVTFRTRLRISPKTLRKHYRDELKLGHVKANVKVAENLCRKATGEGREAVVAAIFWLKTRAGKGDDVPRGERRRTSPQDPAHHHFARRSGGKAGRASPPPARHRSRSDRGTLMASVLDIDLVRKTHESPRNHRHSPKRLSRCPPRAPRPFLGSGGGFFTRSPRTRRWLPWGSRRRL